MMWRPSLYESGYVRPIIGDFEWEFLWDVSQFLSCMYVFMHRKIVKQLNNIQILPD